MVLSISNFLKYFTKSASLALLLLLMTNTSCNRVEEIKSPETFKEYRFQDQVHLLGNDNYPSIQLDIQISLPEDQITFVELYRTMEVCFFDSLYLPEISTDSLLSILSKAYISMYEEFQEELALDSIGMGGSLNWEIIISNDIVFKNQNYICFMVENYGYTGGAHGNTNRNYFVYDLRENQLLTAGDVLDLNQCDAIIELQKNSLEKSGENLDGYWLDGMQCDKNFYLNESGIVFYYDQYEIASYAAGPMSIFIGFDELKPYLLKPQIIEQLIK